MTFDISRDVKLATEQISTHPFQVYVVVKALEKRLSNSGLEAEMFPDFQDKEYVFQTQKNTQNALLESKALLSPEKVQQGDLAAKYIYEMPLLQEAAAAKKAFEARQETKDEWDTISRKEGSRKTLRNLGVAGLILFLCFGAYLIPLGLSLLVSGDFAGAIGGLVTLAISGGWLAGAIILISRGGKANPRYQQLKNSRDNWQKYLMSRDDWNEVVRIFGDLSSKEYQRLYDERLAFLNPILGSDFQKFLTA